MTSSTTASSPIRRLGILQAGRTPEQMVNRHSDYNRLFIDLLGEESFHYNNWVVLDGLFPDSVNEADAWLITGSRHGVYEDHDWIAPLEQFVRDVFDARIPMVGICFGHQLIAQALGGKVEKFSGGWSVGRVEYELDERIFGEQSTINMPVSGTESKTHLLAFHQDQVIDPPTEARNVGSSDFCRHAALAYGDQVLTLQPHPEYDSYFIDGLLKARGEILPADVKQRAEQALEQPLARDRIAGSLRRFLDRDIS